MQKENPAFWQMLDKLISDFEIIIDRPRGSAHPHYPDYIYPVDYGYLKNTASPDGDCMDVWRGTDTKQRLDAVILTVDLLKRDSEIKLLIGCTGEEKDLIYHIHNKSETMKGILITRD